MSSFSSDEHAFLKNLPFGAQICLLAIKYVGSKISKMQCPAVLVYLLLKDSECEIKFIEL